MFILVLRCCLEMTRRYSSITGKGWGGVFRHDHLLPKRQKLQRGHHAALPYAQVAGFVGQLREREAMAALCLEFTVLTAARSGEAMGARWSEIDLDAKLFLIAHNPQP